MHRAGARPSSASPAATYLLPACRTSPFLLLPLGVFPGEGLLHFAGLWHGMNGAYARVAVLALELRRFLDDDAFDDLAIANLQWIAGLNAGLTAPSVTTAHMFSADVPDGAAQPVSMIHGVGRPLRRFLHEHPRLDLQRLQHRRAVPV